MTLENLLKTRQLEPHETNAKQVGKQLRAISRSLEDARQENITAETRLEAGFRAIMQLSMLALWACIAAGEDLLRHMDQWLADNRPGLVS